MKHKEKKTKKKLSVQTRPVAPKLSTYMGWVWGLPDSPDVWGDFRGGGWVHIFTPNRVQAVRPDVWGRFGNSGWRCSK